MTADNEVYVIRTESGFTELFTRRQIEALERLGLIEHERSGHVMEGYGGRPIGPLHHFYKRAVS